MSEKKSDGGTASNPFTEGFDALQTMMRGGMNQPPFAMPEMPKMPGMLGMGMPAMPSIPGMPQLAPVGAMPAPEAGWWWLPAVKPDAWQAAAAKWFAPRMAGFLAQWPDISLHLGATTAISDFERDRVDLAIRYFDGADASLESTLLYADEVRLYCAPDYVKELRLQVPSDLVRATLLHTTLQPHWKSWLQRFSTLSDAQIEAIPHLHFDQSLLAIEAARYGQGAVLSSAILTEAEMRDGALCEPFERRLPVTKGYYVVHHKGTPLRPAALALKNWLLQVAGSEPLS